MLVYRKEFNPRRMTGKGDPARRWNDDVLCMTPSLSLLLLSLEKKFSRNLILQFRERNLRIFWEFNFAVGLRQFRKFRGI